MICYVFEFNPIIGSRNTSLTYKVYSYNKEHIIKFLTQHKMTDGTQCIQTVDSADLSDLDIDDWNELHPYKFGSNRDGKIYTVFTTIQLIEEAYIHTSSILSSACLFGDLITKRNIPIIEECCAYIEKLEYGFVLDLDDGNESYNYYRMSRDRNRWKTCTGSTPNDEMFYSEGPDDSILCDALFEQCNLTPLDTPHVITVEAYTTFFVSLITDSVC